jgi:hypothetical protein
MPPSPDQHPHHPIGPTVGTIIIVILLVVGAVYFAASKLNKEKTPTQVPYIPNGTTTITVTQ